MRKLAFASIASLCLAHPVPYSIDLSVVYDKNKKEVSVVCMSDSKNKCGLHNLDLIDARGEKILTKKFPFLKKKITFSCQKNPKKMIFFLRKIPEHQYIVYFN